MSGNVCSREGCGDTDTSVAHISGHGGRAYRLWLCIKHLKELREE